MYMGTPIKLHVICCCYSSTNQREGYICQDMVVWGGQPGSGHLLLEVWLGKKLLKAEIFSIMGKILW